MPPPNKWLGGLSVFLLLITLITFTLKLSLKSMDSNHHQNSHCLAHDGLNQYLNIMAIVWWNASWNASDFLSITIFNYHLQSQSILNLAKSKKFEQIWTNLKNNQYYKNLQISLFYFTSIDLSWWTSSIDFYHSTFYLFKPTMEICHEKTDDHFRNCNLSPNRL